MKEGDSHGFRPGEGLTSKGSNPYANYGGNMPENGEGALRPPDPIDAPLHDSSPRTPRIDTPIEAAVKAYLYQRGERELGHPLTVEERRSLDMAAELGFIPPELRGTIGNPPEPGTQLHNPIPPERRAELIRQTREARRADQAPLGDEGEVLSEGVRANDLNLQTGEQREAFKNEIYRQVNLVDTLSQEEVEQLERNLTLAQVKSIINPDQMGNLAQAVGARLDDFAMDKRARKVASDQGLPPTKEVLEKIKEEMRPTKKDAAVINERKQNILDNKQTDPAKRLKDIQDNYSWLKKYVQDIYENATQGERTLKLSDATIARLYGIVNSDAGSMTEDAMKANTKWLTDIGADNFNMQQYFSQVTTERKGGRGGAGVIQSLEDLVDMIADAQDHTFATGQKYEIINSRGEIVKENLIAWIRSSIVNLHQSDPDNPIDPFRQISIPAAFRDISLSTIVNTPAYFQRRKRSISGKEGEGGQVEFINTKDSGYDSLKNAMLHEAWLFGVSHSNNATYVSSRGSESELFGAISKLYSQNVFTKNDRILEHILRFAKTDRVEGQSSELQEFLDNKEQGSVGKAIRRSLVAYNYMAELTIPTPDSEASNKKGGIKKEDNPFLKAMGEDGMKHFWQSISETMISNTYGKALESSLENYQPTQEEEELDAVQKVLNHPELYDKFIQESGNKFSISRADMDLYQANPEKLALKLMENINRWKKEDLNIFDKVDKDKRIQDMIHKAIAQAAGRKEGLSKTDAAYAGLWSQSMINWTGIAARNDTSALGFDAWSKLQNFGAYRLRQGQGRSGAGNMFSMPGLKRLSVTMFDGLNVSSDFDSDREISAEEQMKARTFMEVLQGGPGGDIDIDKKMDHVHFAGNAQSQFAANHINNAKSVMDFVLDKMEYKIKDLFKRDKDGSLIFNHEAGHKLMDEGWKNLRYAFDQPRFLYDSQIWEWEQKVVYENGKPVVGGDGMIKRELVFGQKTLREHMFNNEVIGLDMYEGKSPSDKMSRKIFGYLIAKEILAHRKYDSGYEQWSITDIQQIQKFFEHQAQEILIGEDSDGRMVDVKMVKEFINKEEWNRMLGLIKSSYRKMWTIEGLIQLTGALIGGVGQASTEAVKESLKIPKS